jgi:hypothetical protein
VSDDSWAEGRRLLGDAYRHFRAHREHAQSEAVRRVLEALLRCNSAEGFQRLTKAADKIIDADVDRLVIVGSTFIFPRAKTRTQAVEELRRSFSKAPTVEAEDLARRAVFVLGGLSDFFGDPVPQDGAEERIAARLKKVQRRRRFDVDALCVAALQGWGMSSQRARDLTKALRR